MDKRLTILMQIMAFADWHRQHSEARSWKSQDLAAFWGFPRRYFEARLQWLNSKGKISSKRGPMGGYVYNPKSSEKDVRDVISMHMEEACSDSWIGVILSPEITPHDLMPALYKSRYGRLLRAGAMIKRFAKGEFDDNGAKARAQRQVA